MMVTLIAKIPNLVCAFAVKTNRCDTLEKYFNDYILRWWYQAAVLIQVSHCCGRKSK